MAFEKDNSIPDTIINLLDSISDWSEITLDEAKILANYKALQQLKEQVPSTVEIYNEILNGIMTEVKIKESKN